MQRAPATTQMWEKADEMARFLTLDEVDLNRMRLAACRFLDDMAQGKPPRWLSFLGTSGAGKTFLGDLVSTIIKRYNLSPTVVHPAGISLEGVKRLNWEVFLDDMLSTREWGRFTDLCNARYAMIDDIATQYVLSPISTSKLALLAERRIGKWTIFTSNLGLQQIKERLDARIASRLIRAENEVVDVDVIDFSLR